MRPNTRRQLSSQAERTGRALVWNPRRPIPRNGRRSIDVSLPKYRSRRSILRPPSTRCIEQQRRTIDIPRGDVPVVQLLPPDDVRAYRMRRSYLDFGSDNLVENASHRSFLVAAPLDDVDAYLPPGPRRPCPTVLPVPALSRLAFSSSSSSSPSRARTSFEDVTPRSRLMGVTCADLRPVLPYVDRRLHVWITINGHSADVDRRRSTRGRPAPLDFRRRRRDLPLLSPKVPGG